MLQNAIPFVVLMLIGVIGITLPFLLGWVYLRTVDALESRRNARFQTIIGKKA